MNQSCKVSAFLAKHGVTAAGGSIDVLTRAMLADMESGLEKDPSGLPLEKAGMEPSLEMIPTWTKLPDSVPQNEPVIVIDAGGTNFRSCLVKFDSKGNPEITNLEKCGMPGIKKELPKEEFFDAIAENLDHLKNMSSRIGFCFSYAMKITKDGDGQVISFSKEIKAKEVIGSLVGKSLSDALVKRGWNRPEKIILLNDTAAALLAGASTAVDGRDYSSYIGFILGTGMNAAYMERTIPKVSVENDSPQIVVCESGKFNKLPRCSFDVEIDSKTNTPGLYVFEKMCSGAYLGPVSSLALKTAAKEGLFSEKTAQEILALEDFGLIDMDKFLHGPKDSGTLLGRIANSGTDSDMDTMYRILDAFVDRSARLAAANLSAAVIKSGEGHSPSRPVCILCEGTTFLKTHNLQKRVEAYLHTYLTMEKGLYWNIVSMDNAITLGAAVAGLT